MSLHFQGLGVGRIVHYVMPDGEHRPAVVTKVWNSVSEMMQLQGYCNVTVHPDGANDDANIRKLFNLPTDAPIGPTWPHYRAAIPISSVVFDGSHKPGTIHWPEKE